MTYRADRNLARRVIPGMVGALLLATAALAPACKGVVVTTIEPPARPSVGQIGDPCTPSGEAHAATGGSKGLGSGADDGIAACNSGICLSNAFQGRVSCPLGQDAPTPCTGPGDPGCGGGASCVATENFYSPSCDSTTADAGAPQCGSGKCNPQRNTCECTSDTECPGDTVCDPVAHECTLYVCRKPVGCQSEGATDAENAGKICCADGTNDPVSVSVCGQCSARPAKEAVYCSCRCGPADNAPPDDSEYCACPVGFECSPAIPYIGGGIEPEPLSGKYCIKAGTAYQYSSAYPPPNQCGTVTGHYAPYCAGVPAN